MARANSELTSIYTVAHGESHEAACRALYELGKADAVASLTGDALPSVAEVERGIDNLQQATPDPVPDAVQQLS